MTADRWFVLVTGLGLIGFIVWFFWLKRYEVNFDNDKSVLKTFGVQAQATLIVFKGAKEVGRSTGVSDPARIQALVEKGF